jgi:hypothetical protein
VGPGEVFRETCGDQQHQYNEFRRVLTCRIFAESKRPYVMQIVLPFVESSRFRSRWASQGSQGSPVASSGFFDAFVIESRYCMNGRGN